MTDYWFKLAKGGEFVELVEARARAICEMRGINWDNLDEQLRGWPHAQFSRHEFREQARATFKADRTAGYKSLKREPTASGRAAISKAVKAAIQEGGYLTTEDGFVDCDKLGQVSAAIIHANWDAAEDVEG